MTMVWTRQKLEPQCVCIYQGKQSKDNDTNWQQKERLRKRRIFNAWRLMHWHQLRSHSHVRQVFQVTSHIVGFRSVLRVVNFNSCRCNHLINFDLYANSSERFTLRKRVFWVVNTTGLSVLSYRFACILICRLSLNHYEFHQEPLCCHQLEEELDDWCRCWYFQNGIGLSCRSPDSWCRRFNVDNTSLKSERFLNGQVFPDLLREIHQFCLYRKYSDSVM